MPKFDFFIIPMSNPVATVRLQVLDFVLYRLDGKQYLTVTILNFVFTLGV